METTGRTVTMSANMSDALNKYADMHGVKYVHVMRQAIAEHIGYALSDDETKSSHKFANAAERIAYYKADTKARKMLAAKLAAEHPEVLARIKRELGIAD
jgi:hypothetical protein